MEERFVLSCKHSNVSELEKWATPPPEMSAERVRVLRKQGLSVACRFGQLIAVKHLLKFHSSAYDKGFIARIISDAAIVGSFEVINLLLETFPHVYDVALAFGSIPARHMVTLVKVLMEHGKLILDPEMDTFSSVHLLRAIFIAIGPYPESEDLDLIEPLLLCCSLSIRDLAMLSSSAGVRVFHAVGAQLLDTTSHEQFPTYMPQCAPFAAEMVQFICSLGAYPGTASFDRVSRTTSSFFPRVPLSSLAVASIVELLQGSNTPRETSLRDYIVFADLVHVLYHNSSESVWSHEMLWNLPSASPTMFPLASFLHNLSPIRTQPAVVAFLRNCWDARWSGCLQFLGDRSISKAEITRLNLVRGLQACIAGAAFRKESMMNVTEHFLRHVMSLDQRQIIWSGRLPLFCSFLWSTRDIDLISMIFNLVLEDQANFYAVFNLLKQWIIADNVFEDFKVEYASIVLHVYAEVFRRVPMLRTMRVELPPHAYVATAESILKSVYPSLLDECLMPYAQWKSEVDAFSVGLENFTEAFVTVGEAEYVKFDLAVEITKTSTGLLEEAWLCCLLSSPRSDPNCLLCRLMASGFLTVTKLRKVCGYDVWRNLCKLGRFEVAKWLLEDLYIPLVYDVMPNAMGGDRQPVVWMEARGRGDAIGLEMHDYLRNSAFSE